MSESSSEPEQSKDQSDQSGGRSDEDADESMMITDDQLPEDLRPDENPLARDPDDEPDDDDAGSSDDQVEGMPDMGDPGAAG